MNCAKRSWEADIIILSGLYVNDEDVVEKNKGSYTAKSSLWKMKMILLNR
jgi:hypothetical protein